MRAPAAVTTAALVSCAILPARAGAEAETLAPGVVYDELQPDEIPTRVHRIAIDLTATEIDVGATPADERGQTASAFAADAGATAAITGGAYDPSDFSPLGAAIGGGEPWPDSNPGAPAATLSIEKPGLRSRAAITSPGRGPPAPIGDALGGAVAGGPVLVRGGEPARELECDAIAIPCERAPRSAAALAEGGRELWWVVADGWRPDREGITAAEMADFLADLGADEALALDAGAAPTLYAEPLGGAVSEPSDGGERRVANHLYASFEDLDPGELTVLVREGDPFDTGADLEGADVTLDTGESALTDESGEARFEVRPRRVCLTAEATGFEPRSACRQVPPGEFVLEAIALAPEADGASAPESSAAGEEVGPHALGSAGCAAVAGRLQAGEGRARLGGPLFAALALAALARRRGMGYASGEKQ